ncbi:MAG: nuclear transport factor 2 family protein [Chloroflexi bacterium]|nr:nuclear transport factor 2 family protein [Chloroflexota bacterium]
MSAAGSDAPITEPDAPDAVRGWFDLLGKFCADVDYDSAEAIFADDVVSFGTHADIVSGLENLRRNQWEGIWGNIADFRVDLDSVQAFGEGDIAWGVAIWTSTGFDADHRPFDRPGRATVTLARRDGIWLATHTHFSLNPGTPPRTYGRH